MKKNSYNEHLDYILEKTTPYQRMIWLGKAIAFWKTIQKQKRFRQKPAIIKN